MQLSQTIAWLWLAYFVKTPVSFSKLPQVTELFRWCTQSRLTGCWLLTRLWGSTAACLARFLTDVTQFKPARRGGTAVTDSVTHLPPLPDSALSIATVQLQEAPLNNSVVYVEKLLKKSYSWTIKTVRCEGNKIYELWINERAIYILHPM